MTQVSTRNLTVSNKDYAVFLPSISTFYNNHIAKQRYNPNFVPADRMPKGFENGMEGMNFLNEDKAYYSYKWGLYSAGHAQLNLDKAIESDSMVHERDREKNFILGDSGGFQIIKGVIQCDWKNFKTDDKLRRTILNWLELTADYSMILDIPTLAADPAFKERTGIKSFNQCLDYTDFNTDWFIKNRLGSTKYLNVMQGRNWAEAEHWYESMKHHDLDGFAFGGSAKNDINIILRTLIKMRDDQQLERGKRDLLHYLGISKLDWAVVYTAIKRALRETVNEDIDVMFDCASPFIATAKGQMYTQHVHRNEKMGYVMDSAVDSKKLSGSTLPFPWGGPIGERLTMGDICHYAPGMLNKIGKEGKTSWDSFSYMLMMGHNVFQHIESVQRANAIMDTSLQLYDTNYKHWRKLKNGSREEVFDSWTPRNALYMSNFVSELFKSETPYQMLDDAAPMLANFNGAKTLTTSTANFNSLFDTGEVVMESEGEYSLEDEEDAAGFLETV
tara:strand:- start:768 stop:2273 length:1506 start_codon:yes stop_codon:yes gene_type:complete